MMVEKTFLMPTVYRQTAHALMIQMTCVYLQYASKKNCHTVVTKDRLYGALLQKNGRATVRQRSTPLCAAAGGTV